MSTITMGLTVVISHAGVNIIRNNSINKIHADHQTNQYKITSVLHWLQSSLEIDDDPLNVRVQLILFIPEPYFYHTSATAEHIIRH